MGLFKNEVGRPSNETLRKRKIIYASIALVCVLLVGAGVLYVKGFFGGEVGGKSRNAALACEQPYDIKLCENEGYYGRAHGQSIQKLQELLKKAKYHSGYVNGNYGSYTVDAVKKAQKAFGLAQTGKADYKLVEKLASQYGYSYTVISYKKNNGTGSLLGTTDNKEFVMSAKTPISSSVLKLDKNTHVGWVATSTARNTSKTKYYYGCNNKNCASPKMYTEAEKNNLGSNFYPYVFVPSEKIEYSTFNSIKNVSVDVNFDAYYCSATGAKYDKKTSKCSKGTPGYGYTYTATLNVNDAASIGEDYIGCSIKSSNSKGCQVTLPSIKPKANAVVIGWSTNMGSSTATYKQGEKITLTKDIELYAMTRRKITITFNKNDAQSISSTKAECFIYGKTKCTITTPTITAKNGYNVVGWSTDKTGRAARIIDTKFKLSVSENATYYALANNLYVRFPDDDLRHCVLNSHNGSFGKQVDLSQSQLASLEGLDCDARYRTNSQGKKYDIKDLTGIKYLTGLKRMNLSDNTSLKSIDLSNNTSLTELGLLNFQINNIDLSKNTALIKLNLRNVPLTSLDITKNKKLEYLDVSQDNVDSRRGKLTALNLNNNINLKELLVSNNPISKLNLNKNTKLSSLDISSTPISKLELTNNNLLESLTADYTVITSLDLNGKKNLKRLRAYSSKLNNINLTGTSALEYIVLEFNNLSSINLQDCVNLNHLDIDSNKLEKIDLSKNTKLKTASIRYNKIKNTIKLDKLTSLESFDVFGNLITSLDVSHNDKLKELRVGSNKLSKLDVSNNKALEYLDIFANEKITEIDVSKNAKLTTLYVYDTGITKLDVSKNKELTTLYVYDTGITNLDVSKNSNLKTLYITKTMKVNVGNNKSIYIFKFN